ncbi:hypothetical protein Ciccas_006477 [Cichlidogyrus casuarinus]|uniref:Uncharacterized protein n=1 Tax=Cichlidogyrus casuarinus TaxID=1844966 RepID=A0ABD2Q5P5_9PLAT
MGPYKDMSEEFSKRGLKISPLHLRRGLKPRVPHSAVLLTTICLEDGTWLERGSLVTVSTSSHVSTAIHQEWQVEATLKSGRKKIIRMPSSCLWLLSPENSPRWSGSHKSTSPLTNEYDQPFDLNQLNNLLAATEFANEVDGFYREIKDEYRQDVLLDLDKKLEKELTKTNGPIKTEDLRTMRQLLNDANLLTEGHPVNHTELVQNMTRNARSIEEHLIPVAENEKADLSSQELEQMYTPLKAWKNIHDDMDNFSRVQEEISRESRSRPSPTIICKDIKYLLDKQQVPTYSKKGLTCLSDMQSIGSKEDLHSQLKQLSRNASIRKSRKKTTSFTQMSPGSVQRLTDDSSHLLSPEIAYGDPSAPHILPCPCKYCGLKKAAMLEEQIPVQEIHAFEAVNVHAAAPHSSSLPRYPLDDVPAAYGRDRDDYSIATDKEPGFPKKEGTYKGTGRFKFGKKTPKGGKSGHASDDYTSGIESGAETTIFEQDADPSEASKKSKVLCPSIPSTTTGSGKKIKRLPVKTHTLELPDPPEHEMMERSPAGSPRRRINEPQPRGVEGYTWVTRGIPVGAEVPIEDTLVQRSPLPRTPFIEEPEPEVRQYVAPTK